MSNLVKIGDSIIDHTTIKSASIVEYKCLDLFIPGRFNAFHINIKFHDGRNINMCYSNDIKYVEKQLERLMGH